MVGVILVHASLVVLLYSATRRGQRSGEDLKKIGIVRDLETMGVVLDYEAIGFLLLLSGVVTFLLAFAVGCSVAEEPLRLCP